MGNIRSTTPEGVTADAHKWSYESQDARYKKYGAPLFKSMSEVAPIDKIEGEFYQETTAMGLNDIPERTEQSGIVTGTFTEGFSPVIAVRNRAVDMEMTHEVKRDFTKATNFLEKSIKENIPELYDIVINKIVTEMFNKGSVVGGNSIYNQSTRNHAYTPGNLPYDSAEFLSISGTNTIHTNKSGSTYSNGLAALVLNAENLDTADILLTATNAKREDDQPFDNTTGLKCMVSPTYKSKAIRTIRSDFSPDDANSGGINPMGEKYSGYEIIVNPYLTTATSWAIGRAGFGIKLWIGKLKYNFYLDPKTLDYGCTVNFDYACGPTNYRFAVGVGFAIA